jgi:hypothetical protein
MCLTSGTTDMDVMKAGRNGDQWITEFLWAVWICKPKLCIMIITEPPCAAVALCNCYAFDHKNFYSVHNLV